MILLYVNLLFSITCSALPMILLNHPHPSPLPSREGGEGGLPSGSSPAALNITTKVYPRLPALCSLIEFPYHYASDYARQARQQHH